jgi:hypothetical protein
MFVPGIVVTECTVLIGRGWWRQLQGSGIGTINFTTTEMFWNSYGWLISFLLKKRVLVHGLLGHHACILAGVIQIFQNGTPIGEENAFTSVSAFSVLRIMKTALG